MLSIPTASHHETDEDIVLESENHLRRQLLAIWRRTSIRYRDTAKAVPKLYCWVGAIYFLVGSIVAWSLTRMAYTTSRLLEQTTLPAYQGTGRLSHNSLLINYSSLVVFCGGAVGLFALLKSTNIPPFMRRITDALPTLALAVCATLVGLRNPSQAGLLLAFISTLHFLALYSEDDSTERKPPLRTTTTLTICTIAALFSTIIAIRAWYPVILPNDYYELNETLALPGQDGSIKIFDRETFTEKFIVPRTAFYLSLEADTPTRGEFLSLASSHPTEATRFANEIGLDPLVLQRAPDSICERAEALATCQLFAESAPDYRLTIQKSLMMYGKVSPAYLTFLIRVSEWAENAKVDAPFGCTVAVGTNPRCDFPTNGIAQGELTDIENAVRFSNLWIVQAGRLLFHHSYLFVPAKHFLTHGFEGNVPVLYGFGNTLFHALLLKFTDATLESYFNTYPIAQLFGLLAIGCSIWYFTRSLLAGLAAFSLSAGAIFWTGPDVIFLAPGFNPLRFLGACVQVASIPFMFRTKWIAALPIAFVFSIFWNTEYAYLGLTAQLLAIALFSYHLSLGKRVGWIAILLVIPLIGWFLSQPNPDIIQNVSAGFFGVGLPFMPRVYFYGFCLVAIATLLTALVMARLFPNTPERDQRLALIPLILLLGIKFIFNPADPHITFSLSFALPLMICFLPWKQTDIPKFSRITPDLTWVVSLGASLLCLAASVNYSAGRAAFNQIHIKYYSTQNLSAVGDQIRTAMPVHEIEDRITSLQRNVPRESTVLILSPFDHLLAFYANPENVCGHFELLSNLVFDRDMDRILQCLKRNPHTIVVYDSMIETLCPPIKVQILYGREACAGRLLLKRALQSIWEDLLPAAASVQTDGQLHYMKLDPKKLASLTSLPFDPRLRNANLFKADGSFP
jgi:hypothetical protein